MLNNDKEKQMTMQTQPNGYRFRVYKFNKNTFEAFYNDTTLYGCVDYMKRWNSTQMHNWYIIDEDNGYKFKMNQNNELVMA
tara:strand:+ start:158 stop:400 length:243 start_codon:yes stop_codon:yes gene_type:complete